MSSRFDFTDRVRPVLQIGLGDTRVATMGAIWGTSAWDAPESQFATGGEPVWLDVSCESFQAEAEYGRARTNDRFVAGSATILVRNLDGWADPHHIPETAQLSMRPGRTIRFGVAHAEFGLRWLFRGVIDSMTPRYEPDLTPVVEFACIDMLGEVNRARFMPMTAPAETVEARILRILTLAWFPLRQLDIAPSSVRVIAHDLNAQVADLLSQAADSAGGGIWGDTEGRIVFRPRDWQMFDDEEPPEATIGNVEPGDICPRGWSRPFAREDIATRVIMGRDGDTALQVDDRRGQVLYGIEPFIRTDLLTESNEYILDLAERTLETRSASTAPRVRAVTIDARNGNEQIDLMSTVDVFKPSRYRCRLDIDGRRVFDDVYFATAIHHQITAHEWVIEMNLDLAEPYATPGGTKWGAATWDADVWIDLDERAVA